MIYAICLVCGFLLGLFVACLIISVVIKPKGENNAMDDKSRKKETTTTPWQNVVVFLTEVWFECWKEQLA